MDISSQCGITDGNPTGEEVLKIFGNCRTIAVVGLSDRPDRDSYRVAKYLKAKGFRIIPVNPAKTEILGEKSYPDLTSIPDPVDVVDIFRAVEAIPGIVEEAVRIGAGCVWMQQGLSHDESADKARAAGLFVVQSRCIMVEHKKMIG